MAKSLADFQADFQEEVGDLSVMYDADEVERWINEGRTRLPLEHQFGDLPYTAGADSVELPADLVSLSRVMAVEGGTVPAYRVSGRFLVFERATTSAGTLRIFYRTYPALITDSEASTGLDEADRAMLSYALYRFFKKLSASRANYKRYATLVGQNSVGIEDLQAEAERHFQDYLDSVEVLPMEAPSFFYPRGD